MRGHARLMVFHRKVTRETPGGGIARVSRMGAALQPADRYERTVPVPTKVGEGVSGAPDRRARFRGVRRSRRRRTRTGSVASGLVRSRGGVRGTRGIWSRRDCGTPLPVTGRARRRRLVGTWFTVRFHVERTFGAVMRAESPTRQDPSPLVSGSGNACFTVRFHVEPAVPSQGALGERVPLGQLVRAQPPANGETRPRGPSTPAARRRSPGGRAHSSQARPRVPGRIEGGAHR